MTAKITGIILIVIGVATILLTMYFSYNIFMGKSVAPEVFRTPADSITQQKASDSQNIQDQISESVSQQLKGMFPSDAMAKILNLASWSILAGILIFGGTNIAGLGIRLIK